MYYAYMGLRTFILIFAMSGVLVAAGCGPARDKPAAQMEAHTPRAETAAALDTLAAEARAITIMVDPERARPLFKEILDAVEADYPPRARRTATALNDYGAMLNITGSPREALPYHERAVKTFRARGTKTEKDKDDLSRALANLAETQVRLGQIETARRTYQEAYDIAPSGLPAHPDDIGSGAFPLLIAANWREVFIGRPDEIFVPSDFTENKELRDEANRVDRYARAQDLGQNPEKAFEAWMEVLPAMEAAYPARSRKVLIAAGNRGAVLGYFGKNEEAKELQQINIQGSLFYGSEILEDAVHMSRKLGNLGWASVRLNEVDQAEAYFIRSHEIVTAKMPAVNEDLGETHRALSYIANLRGDMPSMIKHAKAAVAANSAYFEEENVYTFNARLDLSRAYSAAGQPVQAERAAREGLEAALRVLGPSHRTTTYLQLQMATELIRQGRYVEAKGILDEALSAERRADGEYNIIKIDLLITSANNLYAMGNIDAAIIAGQEAVRLSEDVGGEETLKLIGALTILGNAYMGTGDYEQVIKTLDRAILLHTEKSNGQFDQTLGHLMEVKTWALANLGENEKALAEIEKVIEAQKKTSLKSGQDFQFNLLLRAELIAILGAPEDGLEIAWPAAVKVSSELTRIQASSSGLATDANEYKYAFERLLTVAVMAGDEDKALWAAQQLLHNSAGRASMVSAYVNDIKDKEERARYKQRLNIAANLTRLQLAYVTAVSRDPSAAHAIGRDISELEDQLAALENSGASKDALLQLLTPVDLVYIRKNLGKDEALILLAEGPASVHIIVVTGKAFTMTPAPITSAILGEKVTVLRRALSAQNYGALVSARGPAIDALRAEAAFDKDIAHELYTLIFTPENEEVLKDVKHLKIVAGGAFSKLPLSVLIRSKPQNPMADADWLIKHWSVTTLTSVRDLGTRQGQRKKPRGFLGVGAPQGLDNDSVALPGLKSLPDLPGALREIQTSAKILNLKTTTLLLGDDAREQNLAALNWADYSIILFSTHGLVRGEIIGLGEPALVLTPPRVADGQFTPVYDGLLTASEIAALDLQAQWIILSACNTAAGANEKAPGLTGLARAFIAAGGDSLLVSHWPVRDDAATFLVTHTIENAQAGMPRAESLQRAMLLLMNDPDIAGAAHPAVWAPFVLVGD